MSYLKVKLNDDSRANCEVRAEQIRFNGGFSIKSVEICEEIQQPKTIETGILMSPAEIAGCSKTLSIDFSSEENKRCVLHDGYGSIGKRIALSENLFPREFYKDTQSTIDWESIPVGSLIRCDYKSGGFNVGYYNTPATKDWVMLTHGDFSCDTIKFDPSGVKSVRIIEEAKV